VFFLLVEEFFIFHFYGRQFDQATMLSLMLKIINYFKKKHIYQANEKNNYSNWI
jgi:hypothetical protein